MERSTIALATFPALVGVLIVMPWVATAEMNPALAPAEPAPIQPAEGAKIYAANCLVCHGGNGNGLGPLPVNLPGKPRNFTDQAWMAHHADGTFYTSIARGVPGTSMPAFAGRLSEREIWASVAYVRGFSARTTSGAPARGSTASSRWTAKHGAVLYGQQCAGCHGSGGRGNGLATSFYLRAPRDLTNRDWMASRSDEQLRGVIRYGVAGSPMPGFVDVLREEEVAALVSFLRELSGTLPGKNPVGGISVSLYARNCAACHGVEGNGDAPGANQLAPRPRDFRHPSCMSAQTDDQLATAIRDGRPGTNMPPFRALLPAGDIAALVRYVRGFAQAIPGAGASSMVPPEALLKSPPLTKDNP